MEIKLRHPFDGDFPLTQGFGRYSDDVISEFHLTTAYSQQHWGLDFGLPMGTPTLAADNGTVKAVGEDSRNGKYVIINHISGYQTQYYHLSEQDVKPGQDVKRGQQIGLSGNTGMTTGPHLHFQLNYNGGRIDPTNYFGEYTTSDAQQAPQYVSEILPSASGTLDASTGVTTQMKSVGNTGNPENPGEWNTLGAICERLGLPQNPNSYEQILIWNPELKTGSYDVIPSNMPVFVPYTYNMPEAHIETAPVEEVVQAPEVVEVAQPEEKDFYVNPGETLGDILVREYGQDPDWSAYHAGSGNVINLLHRIQELNSGFTGLMAGSTIKLPKTL